MKAKTVVSISQSSSNTRQDYRSTLARGSAVPQLLHPLQGGGQGGAIVPRLELPAVLGVVAPPAVGHDRFAGLEIGQGTYQGDEPTIIIPGPADFVVRSLGGESGDGVAVFRVLVRDALDHAAQLAQ